jgi:hypothetical protein
MQVHKNREGGEVEMDKKLVAGVIVAGVFLAELHEKKHGMPESPHYEADYSTAPISSWPYHTGVMPVSGQWNVGRSIS